MVERFQIKLMTNKYGSLTKYSISIYDRLKHVVAGTLIYSIDTNILKSIERTFSDEHIDIINLHIDNLSKQKFIYLDYIMIEEEYRGNKLANKLLDKFTEIINSKHNTYKYIFVYASPFQLSASDIEIPVDILVQFYEKFGFESLLYNDEVDSLMLKIND